jgi:adenosylmethionine-8-amino-7-oxononanoate aminotransferase
VAEPETRRPFPAARGVAEQVAATALDLGLVVWPNAGQLEDGSGDLIMLAPPFIVNEEQIGDMVTLLGQACERTAAILEQSA